MTSLSENTVVTTSGGLVELGQNSIDRTNVAVTGTSTSNATELVATTIVCDGSPIIIEFQCGMSVTNGEYLSFGVWVDGVYTATFEGSLAVAGRSPISAWSRLVPTAGAKTISIRWWKWSGGTSTSYIEGMCRVRVSKIVQASQFIVPLASAPLVTSLPSAPIDGQEIRYLADATNGVVWNLRYRAASSSSYKWEFVGGSSLRSTGAGSSTNSTTPQTTNTPSITVPLAGDYDCSYGGFTQNTAYGVVYNSTIYLYKDTTSLESLTFVPVGTYNGASIAGVYRATSLTASQVLNLRYAVSTTSSTSSFGTLFINATPIRVG